MSMLFDCIAGGTAPDAGRVLLDGRDVTAFDPHARAALGLARTFQIPPRLPEPHGARVPDGGRPG